MNCHHTGTQQFQPGSRLEPLVQEESRAVPGRGMHPISRSSFSSLSSFLSHLTVFIIEYSEVRYLGAHSLCLIVFPNVRSWLGNELRCGNNFHLRHFRSIFSNFQKALLSCLPRDTGFSPPCWVTVSLCKIYCFDNILFYFSLQTLNHNLDLCSH